VEKNITFFYPNVLQLLIGVCRANGCLPLAEFSEDSEFCDCSIVRPADRVAMKDLMGPMQDLIEFLSFPVIFCSTIKSFRLNIAINTDSEDYFELCIE